jgi:hypothetical protein
MDNNLNIKPQDNEDELALHRKAFERRLHKLAQREYATESRGERAPEATGRDVKTGKSKRGTAP